MATYDDSQYGVMDFGFETYEIINPTYAKLVFKLNNAGNLTIEATPSLTPGVKVAGVDGFGPVPKGTKVFDYDKKVIVSIFFEDCLTINDFAKKRFEIINGRKIKVSEIKSIVLYRNSSKFSKKVTISYMDGDINNNPDDIDKAYINITFESVDSNGITNKFRLPMDFKKFDLFAKVLESYANTYHMIKYYNQVETAKDGKLKDVKNFVEYIADKIKLILGKVNS